MKRIKIVFTLWIILLSFSFQAQSIEMSTKSSKLTFKKSSYDWGVVKQGEIVEFDIEFSNAGKSNLVFEKIEADCNCVTITNWEKKIVKPGESSSFHVVFDSKGKKDLQQTAISIISNTDRHNERLIIQGVVKN